MGKGKTVVLSEIIGRLRHAMLFEIRWGGTGNPAAGRQAACNGGRIWEDRDSDRDIKAFLDEIDHPVVHNHLDLYLRIARQEFSHRRSQV